MYIQHIYIQIVIIIMFEVIIILLYCIIVSTNDKWCVENIWNSEEMITNREYLQRRMTEIQREEEVLLRDRSVPRALLPSQDQVEDLAHLRDENFTLAQQVEELRQQITEIQNQPNSSLKENQRILQDVMEQHQQEIKQSNTRLQKAQSQLQESDTRLQETQSQLQESDTRLQETQSQLQESDTRLQDTQVQLQLTQQDSQQQIQVMVCNYNPRCMCTYTSIHPCESIKHYDVIYFMMSIMMNFISF